MKTKAVLFTGINQVEISSLDLPLLKHDEIRVETVMSCLSPGTDLRVLAGQQVGDWKWPVIPGYSMVGNVVACGKDVSRFADGDRVFCIGTQAAPCDLLWGGNIGIGNVQEGKAVKIPDGLEWENACLAKLAAIAYHGSTRSHLATGETVVVIGMGPIGIFSALFHREKGGIVRVADLSEARIERVAKMGLEGLVVEKTLLNTFQELMPDGADLIVDCTGVESLLEQSMQLSHELPWDESWERGSRILIQGSYADRVSFDYDLAFQREMQIQLTRDHQNRDLETVMNWMLATKVPFAEILTDVRSFERAPEAFSDLLNNKDEFFTIGLKWS